MTILRESMIYQLWLALLAVYDESRLHALLVRLGAWCNRQIDESRILQPLCREGVVARAWPESGLCRLLTGLVNLPGWILHKLYCLLPVTFEDQFFCPAGISSGGRGSHRPILGNFAAVVYPVCLLEQRIQSDGVCAGSGTILYPFYAPGPGASGFAEHRILSSGALWCHVFGGGVFLRAVFVHALFDLPYFGSVVRACNSSSGSFRGGFEALGCWRRCVCTGVISVWCVSAHPGRGSE